MLVLKTEEVPNEAPENFKWRRDGRHQVRADRSVLGQNERKNPKEAERCVFNDGEIVERLE